MKWILLLICSSLLTPAAEDAVEIGRIVRVQRRPLYMEPQRRESGPVRAISYTVETERHIYVAFDLGPRLGLGLKYPTQEYQRGARVQVKVDGMSYLMVAPVEGGKWNRMNLDAEEDR